MVTLDPGEESHILMAECPCSASALLRERETNSYVMKTLYFGGLKKKRP